MLSRWRRAWQTSLRARLLILGLTPLVVALPLLIVTFLIVGGERGSELIRANLRSNLGGAHNYLDQVRTEVGGRIGQLAISERLIELIGQHQKPGKKTDNQALGDTLVAAAKSGGLDFLVVALANGTVIASSSGVPPGTRLPDTYVIRQARNGVTSSGYEQLDARDLAALSPQFPARARVELVPPPASGPAAETRGLLINAAAHFPLRIDKPDLILVGGILLNRNHALIDHMRNVIFPVDALPESAEGMTSLFLDDVRIAASRQQRGQAVVGQRAASAAVAAVIEQGEPWIDHARQGSYAYFAGYDPIKDGNGKRIGMIGVAFEDAFYRQAALEMLLIIAGTLTLTMLAISVLFLRSGNELTRRLSGIAHAMSRVERGDRAARAPHDPRRDEVGELRGHFNALLDRIAEQDEIQRLAQAELDRYRQHLEVLVAERTRELRTKTEHLDAIFTLSPDGFVSFDRDHRVSDASAPFQRMTGLAFDEIRGMGEQAFSDLLARKCQPAMSFPGIQRLRAERDAAGSNEDEGQRHRTRIALAAPPQRVVEVDMRMSDVENLSQILYFRDITHEMEVDRMKSEFLSTAAHELRTPMTSIIGYSQLLLEQEFDAATRRELLETMVEQSRIITTIINELLDLSRIEARRGSDFVFEKVTLQDITAAVLSAWIPPAGQSVPAHGAPPEPFTVNADRTKLQQALGNLLSNAYKYSRGPAQVAIEYRSKEEDGQPWVGICVQDHGIGMTQEQVKRIFERFYRADTSGSIPGTGLGMSIVKEIIELHGGTVEVQSAPELGTRATLWFPAA